jgi:co-chaperonin GroES (HSP10)
MQIKPLKGIVYLKVEEARAGTLITESYTSAVEYAEVLAVGEGVDNIKKGDKVFVKAWAVDTITHDDKTYRFVAIDTNGILAVIK